VAAASTITSTTDSTSVTFDKTPPVPPTLNGPAGANQNTYTYVTADPSMVFSSNEPVAYHMCRIDSETTITPCSSPWSPALAIGPHIVRVYSVDTAGNSSSTYVRIHKDTGAPPVATSVSIKTSNATATSTGRVGHTVYVLFKADRSVRLPVVTIAGRVATVQITSTPNNTFSAYTTLVTGDTEGVIPFSISLTSAAGVAAASTITSTTDSTSVTFDKTPPVVSITSPAVNNTTATTTLEVLFGLNEIPQKFICKIDAAAYAPCTSPYIRTDLTSGTHTLYIYGYDLAGNASALASRSFIFRP
jgi:hypothetical protein